MYATVQKWGKIHVAIPAAGVLWHAFTLTKKGSFNTEIFRKIFEINTFGAVYVAKYAAILMSKNKPDEKGERGVILFVSSVAAEEGYRGTVAYGGSKAAINGMLLPMARDLGKFGIRCAAISPGMFWTPFYKLMKK